jgi:hypothetical protein
VNDTNQNEAKTGGELGFGLRCLRCCQKVLTQIGRIKAAIFFESRKTLKEHERVLKLALNEAEALAWQTAYPHLVFPVLASEKVEAVAAWNRHQKAIRRMNLGLTLQESRHVVSA